MTGFYERLINMVIIVSLLLALCVAMDYATNDTIISNDTDVAVPDNVTIVNGSYQENYSGIATTDGKVYTDKNAEKKQHKKLPVISIRSKPSCGCRHGYYWHKRTFINRCPHCHRYGTLANVHKWPARFEQELTCSEAKGGCGADYCGVCGKEKYSWSHYYLTKA